VKNPITPRAVEALLRLTRSGVEYPDAEWQIVRDMNVDADKLREAYDEACAEAGHQ
jgi:hypothetical protein